MNHSHIKLPFQLDRNNVLASHQTKIVTHPTRDDLAGGNIEGHVIIIKLGDGKGAENLKLIRESLRQNLKSSLLGSDPNES